jgi:hypothetical protein
VVGKDDAHAFFERLAMIERLGLLVFVPHVVDGDGAPVYPCSKSTGHAMEVELGAAAREAAIGIAEAWESDDVDDPNCDDIIAVVPAHGTAWSRASTSIRVPSARRTSRRPASGPSATASGKRVATPPAATRAARSLA